MKLKQGQLLPLLIHTIVLVAFVIMYLVNSNHEFLGYVVVILIVMALILYTNHKIDYPLGLIWGLSIWSMLHMAGGGIVINGEVLYSKIILDIIGEPYNIVRYDQLVHIIGFGTATYLMYTLISPLIKPKNNHRVPLLIVITLAGLGAGSINEIIEFFMTVFAPQTEVGGYINNSLDQVANLVGALLAGIAIVYKKK